MTKITYGELLKKLADPDIPMADLDAFLIYKVDENMGNELLILPNWENVEEISDPESASFRTRGNLGLGFLNSIYRGRRRKKFHRRRKKGDTSKVLLSEGDSWFQFPKFLKDTIDWLNEDFNIYSLGAAGDTLMNMLKKNDYWNHLLQLNEDGIEIHALLFSAGGNDIVGPNLKNMLRPFSEGASAQDLLIESIVSAQLTQLINDYTFIFERMKIFENKDREKPFENLPVLFHGYSYSIPRPDQGFNIPPLDGWLGDPMREIGIVDLTLQKEIVRILIDRTNEEFSALADRFDNAVYVNNRNIFSEAQWHDELHPDDEGFEKVAANFKQHLIQVGVSP